MCNHGSYEEKNMKKNKKIKTIILVIVAVLLVVLAVIGIRFRNTLKVALSWDNIVSLVNSQRYERTEIEEKMQDNKKEMEKIAKEDPNINIRGDLTEEETKALKDGLITKEEAALIVKGDITLEEILNSKKKEEEQVAEEKPDKPKPEDKPAPEPEVPQDRASQLISELYVLQADFIARLEEVGNRAYADYKAQGYDRSKVMTIVDSYMGEVSNMEFECDQQVKALLKELEAELAATGGDLSVVSKIRKYYNSEKTLKKTYYLNRLNEEDYK